MSTRRRFTTHGASCHRWRRLVRRWPGFGGGEWCVLATNQDTLREPHMRPIYELSMSTALVPPDCTQSAGTTIRASTCSVTGWPGTGCDSAEDLRDPACPGLLLLRVVQAEQVLVAR